MECNDIISERSMTVLTSDALFYKGFDGLSANWRFYGIVAQSNCVVHSRSFPNHWTKRTRAY